MWICHIFLDGKLARRWRRITLKLSAILAKLYESYRHIRQLRWYHIKLTTTLIYKARWEGRAQPQGLPRKGRNAWRINQVLVDGTLARRGRRITLKLSAIPAELYESLRGQNIETHREQEEEPRLNRELTKTKKGKGAEEKRRRLISLLLKK